MSLFKTFDEVKRFIGADANNELRTIEPYFDDAARDYLVNVLSQDEFDLLETNYTNNALTAAQEEILPLAQNVLANFGYYLFADDGTMQITDSGFLRLEHTEAKSAYQWQVRNFKARRWTNGWRAMEKLAKTLYANMNNHVAWRDSEERKLFNGFFCWHTLQMKKYFRIDNWGTMWALQAEFLRVQEDYIRPLVTVEVYDSLVADTMEDNLTAKNEPLLPLVQAVQVFGVLKASVLNYGFEFGKDGLASASLESTNSNEQVSTITPMLERERLLRVFQGRFNAASCKLKTFLDTNSSATDYPSYYNKFVNIEKDNTDHNQGKGTFLI